MDEEAQVLQDAIAAIRRGDKATGHGLLARLLRANPRSEAAWLWLADTLDDPARRRECYQRALAINPDSQPARQYLSLQPAPPPVQPPTPTPTPAAAPRKRGPGLAIVLIGLIILTCVACWGVASSRSPRGTIGVVQSPTQVAPKPTDTYQISARLPGLTQGDLKVYFEARHFTCSNLEPGQRYYTRTCTRNTSRATYRVAFSSKATAFFSIDCIDATVLQYGDPDDAVAADFLGAVAAFPYDGAEPGKARVWVEVELSSITSSEVRNATFGGVPYKLSGKPAARTLIMGSMSEYD